jgi:uncharacterized protein (TIRG00374 family)
MCRIRYKHRWLRPLRRRWPLLLLLVLILLLLLTRLVEIRQLLATLARGRWQYMLAALFLVGLSYGLYAVQFQFSFATVGVESRVLQLIPVLFASILAGTVAPTGGLTAAAVLIEDAVRRQQSPARATEGVLLSWVSGLLAMVPLLLIGLAYLHLQGALHAFEVAGAALYLLYIGVLIGVLLLAIWQPSRLRRLLRRVQRAVNALLQRLGRPPLLGDDWVRRNAAESTGAAIAIIRRPGWVLRTVAVALGTHLISLASLLAVSLAFGHAMSLGALAAGFSVGYVFSIISIIPFDLGVVEGIMTYVYASLGVPLANALVVSLAFRGLNTWLPIALSFLALRRFRRRHPQDDA